MRNFFTQILPVGVYHVRKIFLKKMGGQFNNWNGLEGYSEIHISAVT